MLALPAPGSQDDASITGGRRQVITGILEEMEGRIVRVAVEFELVASKRRCWRAWQALGDSGHRRRELLRLSAGSFLHRNLKKGINGWIAFMTQIAMALAQLRSAAMAFRQRGLRKAMNQLTALQKERKAKLRKLKGAAKSLMHRNLRKGYNKLAAGGRLFRLVKKAAASFVHRHMRKGYNVWVELVMQIASALAQLRAAAGAFRMRNARKAMNQLVAQREARRALLAKLNWAAKSLVNRNLRKGYNKLAAGGRLRRLAKKAAASFLLRHRRRGLNVRATAPDPSAPIRNARASVATSPPPPARC